MFGIAVFLAAAFVALCFFVAERSRLFVHIENASGSAVTNINVKFKGGNLTIASLNDLGNIRRPFNVQSESSLSISFYDAKGLLYETNLDTYLEPSYCGYVRLKIDRNRRVQMKDETRVDWLP